MNPPMNRDRFPNLRERDWSERLPTGMSAIQQAGMLALLGGSAALYSSVVVVRFLLSARL